MDELKFKRMCDYNIQAIKNLYECFEFMCNLDPDEENWFTRHMQSLSTTNRFEFALMFDCDTRVHEQIREEMAWENSRFPAAQEPPSVDSESSEEQESSDDDEMPGLNLLTEEECDNWEAKTKAEMAMLGRYLRLMRLEEREQQQLQQEEQEENCYSYDDDQYEKRYGEDSYEEGCEQDFSYDEGYDQY
jgi:hypothetical protein